VFFFVIFVIFVSFVADLGVLRGHAITLISVEDEIAIGRQANADTRKKIPELPDREVRAYVRSIGARLAKAAPGPRYPYSFSVANYREITSRPTRLLA